jgi:hypothetical protein
LDYFVFGNAANAANVAVVVAVVMAVVVSHQTNKNLEILFFKAN